VAFGGWSLDLHPADGVFSEYPNACNQWHSKGVYQIPYRCYLSPDLDNVYLGGRIIGATHVAFASTRVMATSAAGGEAIGTAVAYCLQNGVRPACLMEPEEIKKLQQTLVANGVYLPQISVPDVNPLLSEAEITVSSELELSGIPFDGAWKNLSQSAAQMLPLAKGKIPQLTVRLKAREATRQQVELRISSKSFNHTPDITLETLEIDLEKGEKDVTLVFRSEIPHDCYVFVCFMKNEQTEIMTSRTLITGLVSVFNKILPAVSNWGKQDPKEDIGVEAFEFWCPERRPDGQNIAMKISPAPACFSKENLRTMPYRPITQSNAWVADFKDKPASVTLSWKEPQSISSLTLFTDTDFDHAMESVQWGHYDNRMPFCIDRITVCDANNRIIKEVTGNHQTIVRIVFDKAIQTDKIRLVLDNSDRRAAVALFGIRLNA
jgi:hypothetical protein